MATMRAAVFVEKNRIVLEDKPVPEVGPLDALIRITTTTICGTDVHILRGEYPVDKGLTDGRGAERWCGPVQYGYRYAGWPDSGGRATLRRLRNPGPGVADPGVVGGDGAVLKDIARATDKNQVVGTRRNQSVVLLLD
ncbi:hypothetical protein EMIT0196MI5_230047 [Pseudomonas sp. IT-196MI5]